MMISEPIEMANVQFGRRLGYGLRLGICLGHHNLARDTNGRSARKFWLGRRCSAALG